MRVVIDLQSLQTGSHFRGIGRYSLSLVRALLELGTAHDFWIVINDHEADTVVEVHEALASLINEGKILIFATPININEGYEHNQWRTQAAEIIRSEFLRELAPDVVLTTSLFEFDAVTSIEPPKARPYIAAAILYDLIPLIEPEVHLGNPQLRRWYNRKLESLRNADLLLAISEYTRTDAIHRLGIDSGRCKAILSAGLLGPLSTASCTAATASAVGELPADCVLYVGGFDPRKNVDKLIEAYSRLPRLVRERHRLVLAGKIADADKMRLLRQAASLGIKTAEMTFPGFVSDELLITYYKSCRLFVYPSGNEGFGLPPLEAMNCGAAVIAADRASLVEVVALKEALFDPDDGPSFARLLHEGVTNDRFRERLIAHGRVQAGKFSWDATARKALAAIEAIATGVVREPIPAAINARLRAANANATGDPNIDAGAIERIGAIEVGVMPDTADLIAVAKALARNAETIRRLASEDVEFGIVPGAMQAGSQRGWARS